MKQVFIALFLIILALFTGCSKYPFVETSLDMDSNLPQTNLSIYIENLGSCYDDLEDPIAINTEKPITILVHGCFASEGEFKALSKVLAFHGQQSVCFRYNDRDSLVTSANQLTQAVNKLAKYMKHPQINVIGHSQGGLIARKALVEDSQKLIEQDVSINLATISAPFAGIEVSKYCANPYLRLGTLGLHDAVCWIVSGDKWYEITPKSDFMQKPGHLSANVHKYLLIATDEHDSCRMIDEQNRCLADDYVFSLNEQKLPLHVKHASQKNRVVKAGHVAIVGKYHHSPKKLIQILQEEGFIKETTASRKVAFSRFLDVIFRVNTL